MKRLFVQNKVKIFVIVDAGPTNSRSSSNMKKYYVI